MLLKTASYDGIGVVVGGAWVPFWTVAELEEVGYKDNVVHRIPGRVLDALPRTIGDGVLVKKPGHDSIGVIVGGAWIPFWSLPELVEAGYQNYSVHMIPGRVLDRLPRKIRDGVLVKKPGHDSIGVVVGGAWLPFHTMAELIEAGYKDHLVNLVPSRVLDALPTTIGDGTRIKAPDSPAVWVVTGGHRSPAGAGTPAWTVPARLVHAIPKS